MRRISLPNKKILKLIAIFVLAILVILFVITPLARKYTKHQKNRISESSVKYATQGKYNQAAEESVKLYNKQTDAISKADAAREAGLNYYYDKDLANGKLWFAKAADLYKQAGDKDNAQTITQESDRLYQIYSAQPQETTEGQSVGL